MVLKHSCAATVGGEPACAVVVSSKFRFDHEQRAGVLIRLPPLRSTTLIISPPPPLPEQEAWNAIQKKHPALPVLFVSAGEDKAMAYAGVPQDLSKQLPAGGWMAHTPSLLL